MTLPEAIRLPQSVYAVAATLCQRFIFKLLQLLMSLIWVTEILPQGEILLSRKPLVLVAEMNNISSLGKRYFNICIQ